MFFSKIFFFLLVNQIFQISSGASCGNDTGPAFEPKKYYLFASKKSSAYNLPWSVIIECNKQGPRRMTHGAIISEKHILAANTNNECDGGKLQMSYHKKPSYPSFFKTARLISSMKPIEGAPHFALITLKDGFKFEGPNTTVCLPNKGDSVSDFEGEYIYNRYYSDIFRSKIIVDSEKNCDEFSKSKNIFCSSYRPTFGRHHKIAKGSPGTVERDGRHILVGLAYKTMKKAKTVLYHDVTKYVEAIRKQMAEDVDKTEEPSTSAEDPKSAGGKPSSIYEVVNKNANK